MESNMNKLQTLIYLDLSIEYHKDIRDTSYNDYDKKWKQGQIDMLSKMIMEIEECKNVS